MSEYLDKAFDLEAPERERWLADLATTEPNVADTLRRLLARQDSLAADGFLETSPLVVLSDLAAGGRTAKAGERIGAYTLERPIGRGGMGEVWLASRSDGRFEGRCAIKFLDTLAGPGRFVERFRHEGRLLARLAHPNIARLIDAGATEDERQYLAIEYVDGEPIHQYCASHSLDVRARVRLFCDVVAAVATAHANLIIHRDLKPTNVLVTREGTAKLLDFGIAKLLTDDDEGGLTRFEEVALTPEYAAPEQLLGEVPSTATDVYQLGMLLYVLLTERHPLQSAGGRAERIRAALDGRVPPASELATGPVRAELRGDLDAILSMALRKDPRERYATAAALRDDLVRYLHLEPVSARRGAALYQTRKFVQRHRFAVFGTTIAVASLCAALIFAFSQARLAAGQRDRAMALAERNQAVTMFVGTVLSEAAASDKPVTVNQILERSERLALADTSGDRESRAAVLYMIANDYQSGGDHARSLSVLERAITVLGDSSDDNLRAQMICAKAILLTVMGRAPEGMPLITTQLDHLPADPTAAAECLHARALIAVMQSDAATTLRYGTAALERIRATGKPGKFDEAAYLGTIGAAYFRMGQLRESFSHYDQALHTLATLGRDHSPTANAMRNNYGVANDTAGVPKRALQLFDETIRILSERDADGPRPSSALLVNRARVLQAIGRHAEARTAYESAMATALRTQDPGAQAYSMLGLADLARESGDIPGATKYTEQMAERLGPNEPPDSVLSAKLALARGQLDLIAGRIDAARAQFARALISKRSKPTTIEVELARAELDMLTGDASAAADDAQRGLNIATSLQGGLPYSRRTGLALLMLGKALRAKGDRTGAGKAFEGAVTHLSNTVDADHPSLSEARALLHDWQTQSRAANVPG
jgi:eukaryotic-like serine/threonine-protein kinase